MELTFDLGPGDDRLFIDESLEQIGRIEDGLLELERGEKDSSLVNQVFRAAHTLKGSAATIGHRRMAELTHAMEDIFGALRSERLENVTPFADDLFSTIDILRALVEEVTAGHTITDGAEAVTANLRTRLATVLASEPAGGAPAVAAAAPPGGATAGHPFQVAHHDGLHTIVHCRVDPASEWAAVRLLQALMEADETHLLVASSPARDEVESGAAGHDLQLLFTGEPESYDALRKQIQMIDDIVEVLVTRATPAEVTAAEGGHPSAAAAAASNPATPANANATDASGASDRRRADVGEVARDLPAEQQLSAAGDRLKAVQQTIRIDVSRLDELMNLVGELVVHKTRIQRQAHEMMVRLGDDPLARDAEEGAQQFARIASQLQDQVTGLRMLPIETVFNRFPRVVRDLANQLGKEVQLVVEGKETELDRSVLEEVGDPLGHLVRNAIDHGFELPDVRLAAGKPAAGILRMGARHADGQIIITVEDDGRGMDPEALRQAAINKGILTPEAAAALTDNQALKIIFMPGFSTAVRVTGVSGRGVGMDVVRTNIERLGGRVELTSTPGKGTRVELSLPLTLAIIGALLVKTKSRICALPLTGVVETLRRSSTTPLATSGARSRRTATET